jgi:Protein of unknown function (DUF1559)
MSESLEPGTPFAGKATRKNWGINLFTVLAILGIGAVVVAFCLPAAQRGARVAVLRSQCKNYLRQIAVALHQYEEEYHALPPAYTVDAYGNPLHSWRTLILPYLDQKPLYDSIDLSKPWDDPVNARASNASVEAYRCPSIADKPHHTIYMASAATDGCFRPAQPRLLSEINDGLSNTLLVFEVPLDQSVPWMSPLDADEAMLLRISPESKLAHPLAGGFNAALCDGSVRSIAADLPGEKRRALISIAGGEKVEDF